MLFSIYYNILFLSAVIESSVICLGYLSKFKRKFLSLRSTEKKIKNTVLNATMNETMFSFSFTIYYSETTLFHAIFYCLKFYDKSKCIIIDNLIEFLREMNVDASYLCLPIIELVILGYNEL